MPKKIGITYPFGEAEFQKFFDSQIILINSPEELNESFDLIIVPGGEDVHPSIYGEKNYYSYPNPARDRVEVPIVNKAIDLKLNIFAGCRGHQLVNALSGNGMLIQDLYQEKYDYHPPMHTINFGRACKLRSFFDGVSLASTHHQAVKNTSYSIVATFGNVVEATETQFDNGNYLITMQSHPEFSGPDYYKETYKATKNFFNWMLKNV